MATNFKIKMLYATNKLHLSLYISTASGNPCGFSLSVLHYFLFAPSNCDKMHRPHKVKKSFKALLTDKQTNQKSPVVVIYLLKKYINLFILFFLYLYPIFRGTPVYFLWVPLYTKNTWVTSYPPLIHRLIHRFFGSYPQIIFICKLHLLLHTFTKTALFLGGFCTYISDSRASSAGVRQNFLSVVISFILSGF